MTAQAKLLNALLSIHGSRAKSIASPPGLRRASVAIILRLRPNGRLESPIPDPRAEPSSREQPFSSAILLDQEGEETPHVRHRKELPTEGRIRSFFEEKWVADSIPEVLLIKRATREGDRWSGHLAFPGGRQEEGDEGDVYTAMRETWEEITLDLADKEYIHIGRLDDREVTANVGKNLVMVLSAQVFLCTSKFTPIPKLQPTEVASVHWVPLDLLHPPKVEYGSTYVDMGVRLTPRHATLKFLVRLLFGNARFNTIKLPNNPAETQIDPLASQYSLAPPGPAPKKLDLWGLSLGITLDLLRNIYPDGYSNLKISPPYADNALINTSSPLTATFLSTFPQFTYPDINLLIWLFSFRYRRLMNHRLNPLSTAAKNSAVFDNRVNWTAMCISSYNRAIRKAVIVVIIFRAVFLFSGVAWLAYSVKKSFGV